MDNLSLMEEKWIKDILMRAGIGKQSELKVEKEAL